MKYIICLFVFCSSLVSYTQNFPPNPKAGECYVRCMGDNGTVSDWKEVECDLVLKKNHLKIDGLEQGVYNEKDKKRIKKQLLKILKKGFTVELLSHYHSNKTDSVNENRSIKNSKILFSYLKTKGVDSKQIIISAYGNSESLKDCNSLSTCENYYKKNTRIEYRVVNATTRKNGVWRFDNENKIWCYKGKVDE